MVACNFETILQATGCLQLSRGYTAEYIDVGSGEPIVLVPGLCGGIGLLEPFIDELSRDHRVLACQLRGEGVGFFDRGFGLDQYVTDLNEFLSLMQLERPGLVGLSFGGAIALDYATRFSHRLGYLVVQGAGSSYHPGLLGEIARSVLDRLPLPFNNPFVNQFFSLLVGGKRREGDCFDFVVNRCWQTDQSVMAHRLALLEDDFNLESHLWAIRTPTLVVCGEKDVVVSAQDCRQLSSQVTRARLELLKDAGHLAFVTHPTDLADTIREFEHSE